MYKEKERPPGGTQQSFKRGSSAQMPKTLTLSFSIFDKKSTPFEYPLLTNGNPFTSLF